MNSELFDMGPRKVPKQDLIRVLVWGRKQFGIGEDDWTEEHLSMARKQLDREFADVSLHELHRRFIRLRRDKDVPKSRKPRNIAERVLKAGRDFKRLRDRRGFVHSEDYTEWITSAEWREVCQDHKEACDYRCQLCGAETKLEIHHTPVGYSHLGNEDTVHIMALCVKCHLIADMLRETHGAY